MNVDGTPTRTVRLDGRALHLVNQPLLPHRFEILTTTTYQQTADAIRTMVVRGAGAIGATGAAGMAQAVQQATGAAWREQVDEAAAVLADTRPTAQNLFYGIRAVQDAIADIDDQSRAAEAAIAAANAVADEDAACCRQIGVHGAALIEDGARVATHCNAGWLAFVDWGSALSPVYVAHREGRSVFVWVDETRPRAQGARLTAWELGQEGVPHAVLADNALGSLLMSGQVDLVITGADRVAANGDVANKIGTCSVAGMARHAGVPFYVALPTTTIDPDCPSGDQIPIEERSEDEVAYTWGWSDDGVFQRVRTVAPGSDSRNPAFDVTPADWVTGLITEVGLVDATADGIATALRQAGRA